MNCVGAGSSPAADAGAPWVALMFLTERPMTDDRTSRLLAEYQANVELWKHDDSLRQQRIGNFLTVNTILLVTITAIVGLKPPWDYVAATWLLISVFGLLVCRMWYRVHVRNAEYVRFRRFQLRSIEAELTELTTFTNTYDAFYEYKPVDFPKLEDRFELDEQAKRSSTLSESVLPQLLGGFWTAVLLIAVVVLLVSLN